MEASTPIVRVRIEHSRTIKEGWGYSSTVEVTDGQLDSAEMKRLLAETRRLAEVERDIRNEREAARAAP